MGRNRKPLNLLPEARRTRKSGARLSDAPEASPEIQAIWHTIASIPHGSATTYGEVARASGLPGRARLAGLALRMMIDEMQLPWHRVVGSGGKIAFPKSSSKYRLQARLLRSEGVPVKGLPAVSAVFSRFSNTPP